MPPNPCMKKTHEIYGLHPQSFKAAPTFCSGMLACFLILSPAIGAIININDPLPDKPNQAQSSPASKNLFKHEAEQPKLVDLLDVQRQPQNELMDQLELGSDKNVLSEAKSLYLRGDITNSLVKIKQLLVDDPKNLSLLVLKSNQAFEFDFQKEETACRVQYPAAFCI